MEASPGGSHRRSVTGDGRLRGAPVSKPVRVGPSDGAPLRGSDISAGISGVLGGCGDGVWVHKASSSSEESEG